MDGVNGGLPPTKPATTPNSPEPDPIQGEILHSGKVLLVPLSRKKPDLSTAGAILGGVLGTIVSFVTQLGTSFSHLIYLWPRETTY